MYNIKLKHQSHYDFLRKKQNDLRYSNPRPSGCMLDLRPPRNQLDVGSGIKDCVGYISLNAEDIQMHYGLILSSIIFVWKDDIM